MSAELRRLGIEAVRQQRFGDAVRWLAKYVVTAPDDDAEARLALALAYAGAGDANKALTIIDRLMIQQPKSANLHFQRGFILERLDRKRDAADAFRQALTINPNHANARKRLAVLDGSIPPPTTEIIEDAVLIDDDIVEDAQLVEINPRRRRVESSSDQTIYIVLGSAVALTLVICLVIFLTRSKDSKTDPPNPAAFPQAQTNPVPTDDDPFKPVNPKAKRNVPDMRRGDDAAVDRAIEQLRNREKTWHTHSLISLSHLKPNGKQSEVVALVLPLLDDSHLGMHVIDVLKGWGTRDCIPALRRFENDSSTIIKRKAAEAIAAIEQRS